MRIFKIVLFFCISHLFITFGEITILEPIAGDLKRGQFYIKWTDPDNPGDSYSIYASKDDWNTTITLAANLPSDVREYLCDSNNLGLEDSSNWEIKIERSSPSVYSYSGKFTIDNTPPEVNLKVCGKIKEGETINYSGTWSDLSGVEVLFAELLGDTDNDFSNGANSIRYIDPPSVIGESGSGSFGGGFTLTEDLINEIKNYPYLWIRVLIQDKARDKDNNANGPVEVLLLIEEINVEISGFVRDFTGNPLISAPVILSGDAFGLTYTDSTGKYSFSVSGYYFEDTDMTYVGDYFISPVIQGISPTSREYDGLYSGRTIEIQNQNFVLSNGCRFKKYDLGNSNEYYFFTTTELKTPYNLFLDWQFGYGGEILTGDVDNDGKLDLLIKTQNNLYGYSYDSISKSYKIKFNISTGLSLGSIDEFDEDINGFEIILNGTGQTNSARILGKTGLAYSVINSINISGAPEGTKWFVRYVVNGKVLLAGSNGSDYNKLIFYDCKTGNIIWERDIDQIIEPEEVTIRYTDSGKIMIVFGGRNNTSVKLYAIDLLTGDNISPFPLTLGGGLLRVIVSQANTEIFSFPEIIGILSEYPSNRLIIYRTDGGTTQFTTNIFTSDFQVSTGDINGDGSKELIISDGSENIYIINLESGEVTQGNQKGKIWTCVDILGNGKKQIIASKGSTIQIYDEDFTSIASYNLNDTIYKVIVSDIDNNGTIDIIASSLYKTYILRFERKGEKPEDQQLPNIPPVIKNISVVRTAEGFYKGILLEWTYQLIDDERLIGFKIERSDNSSSWSNAEIVRKTVEDWKNGGSNWGYSYDNVNNEWYFWYLDDPPHPYVGRTYTYYYRVVAYNNVSNVNSDPMGISFESEIISAAGGGCFIASVCFGEDSWQVKILRKFRDKILMRNYIGRKFVEFYYRNSPILANYLKEKIILKEIVKFVLYSIVVLAWILIHPFILVFVIPGIGFMFRKKIKGRMK
ncbi:MAG: hypothetical protein NC922_03410 [Candidatus Omnitrophica bacterium]|nr:hypothetical protein [Candidatus Omnitrophota bacterium]